ncbi:hypothetical protein J6590_056152 [Homalodisca vitripennis]|nr:hypothetical protein J6590_056152 [Homalodisca vitripennis]
MDHNIQGRKLKQHTKAEYSGPPLMARQSILWLNITSLQIIKNYFSFLTILSRRAYYRFSAKRDSVFHLMPLCIGITSNLDRIYDKYNFITPRSHQIRSIGLIR